MHHSIEHQIKQTHHIQVTDPRGCTWERVLTQDEALAMWMLWVSNLPSSCPHINFVTNNIQYIRVPTKVEVNFETSQMRSNSAEALVKRLKKPTTETIEREVSKLNIGLDTFGGKDVSAEAVGQQMVRSGVGQGFTGLAASLPDIKALVPEKEDDDDSQNGDKKGDVEEEADEEVAEEQKAAAKKKYWYKDGYIAEKEHELTDEIETVAKQLHEQKAAVDKDLLAFFVFLFTARACLCMLIRD